MAFTTLCRAGIFTEHPAEPGVNTYVFIPPVLWENTYVLWFLLGCACLFTCTGLPPSSSSSCTVRNAEVAISSCVESAPCLENKAKSQLYSQPFPPHTHLTEIKRRKGNPVLPNLCSTSFNTKEKLLILYCSTASTGGDKNLS